MIKLDLSKVEVSPHDIRKGLTFPTVLNENLAELIGILIGDGHLSVIKRGNKLIENFTQSVVYIAGHKDEKQYLEHISLLFYRIFNCHLSWREDKRSRAVLLTKYSKGIVQYLNKICGIPIGRKSDHVGIPNIIKISRDSIKSAFLRGLADTDFTVSFKKKSKRGHSYPVLRGSFKSEKLVRDLERLYEGLGYKHSCCYNMNQHDRRFGAISMHHIYLNGKKNLLKWVSEIGFSHPKFNRKIRKWQEDGVCPPGY